MSLVIPQLMPRPGVPRAEDKDMQSAEGKLLRKTSPWKRLLADSVVAAHRKLAEYYSMTDGARGKIYNWATVLDPTQRLKPYKTANFSAKLRRQYEADFRQRYESVYAKLELRNEPASEPVLQRPRTSFVVRSSKRNEAYRLPSPNWTTIS
jgi:hypothetical protein